MPHHAGFVSIIGKPNAGKSTLLNALIGERLSIITPKAQTTRHRILGIYNTPDMQIVFSDTPGHITAKYRLQETMMKQVSGSIDDADLLLLVTDIHEKHDEADLVEKLKHRSTPLFVLINKIDTATQQEVEEKEAYWNSLLQPKQIMAISATNPETLRGLLPAIESYMPLHPPYYDKEDITDRNMRFITAEIIREKILLQYHKEIPYSSEVIVTEYLEEEGINRISAEIIVERDSQKNIIIGKGGAELKKVGTQARIAIEKFTDKKCFLQLHVKVIANWRNKENYLKSFGYEQ